MESKNRKTHSKSKNYGFYVALSLCLVAVGVAAFSAVSAFNEYNSQPSEPQTEPPSEIITDPAPDTEAQNELPQIEYEVPAEPESEDSKTEQIPTADRFVLPVENGNVIKKFDANSLQYSATLQDMRLHEGVDISASEGSTVRSAGTGTVTEIYCDSALGHTVVIDHGNGILAKYCGLAAEIPESVGNVVSAGQEIGVINIVPIESADESHLHLEIYKNGKAENPLEIMGMQ